MSIRLLTEGVTAVPSIQKDRIVKTLAAFAACMLGFAGVCDAAQIASPKAFGSSSQKVTLCIIYNSGTTPQNVNVRLFDSQGNALTGVNGSANCGGSLLPGAFCEIAKIGISPIDGYACTATASSVVHLRGDIILQDGFDTSLRSAPLR